MLYIVAVFLPVVYNCDNEAHLGVSYKMAELEILKLLKRIVKPQDRIERKLSMLMQENKKRSLSE
jgi:hypothetical protein